MFCAWAVILAVDMLVSGLFLGSQVGHDPGSVVLG